MRLAVYVSLLYQTLMTTEMLTSSDITTWARGFKPELVGSNLSSWVQTWARGYKPEFVGLNLSSLVQIWARGFKPELKNSNLSSWVQTWVSGLVPYSEINVYSTSSSHRLQAVLQALFSLYVDKSDLNTQLFIHPTCDIIAVDVYILLKTHDVNPRLS